MVRCYPRQRPPDQSMITESHKILGQPVPFPLWDVMLAEQHLYDCGIDFPRAYGFDTGLREWFIADLTPEEKAMVYTEAAKLPEDSPLAIVVEPGVPMARDAPIGPPEDWSEW